MDTIFALSTVPGRGAIAVVRLSGPNAADVLAAFCGKVPPPRFATYSKISDPSTGETIDRGLVLFFEKDHSYTGEAMAEFQIHGGLGVVDHLITALNQSGLCRLAERGEFTRRALENDRLDLLQAEGVGDLIAADTREQIRMANEMLSGALTQRIQSWRDDLIYAAALVEATLDFADEEVPQDVGPEVGERLGRVTDALQVELAGFEVNERIREGFEVAIVGPPNAGKSSLLNVLAGREAAITSDIQGTTRDVIEVSLDLGGLPVTFLDTAGLRETSDVVESIGIENTLKRADAADLRIVFDHTDGNMDLAQRDGDIFIHGKSDLKRGASRLNVSSVSREGIDELLEQVSASLKNRVSSSSLISRERHRSAVFDALDHLSVANHSFAEGNVPSEILSEQIKDAIRSLESLIGRVGVEDLLDKIFSSFCIGK